MPDICLFHTIATSNRRFIEQTCVLCGLNHGLWHECQSNNRIAFLRQKNLLGANFVLAVVRARMAKATLIKEALKRWEEQTKCNSSEATDIGLQFQWPPIEKMDATLSTLIKCEKLSLSTNMIEKITGLNGMKNLRILSLGRNYVKSLAGLESVADTLEELWISYNLIEKLKGINVLRKLRVLHISNNQIKDWVEFTRLQEMTCLEDLLFMGNPLHENFTDELSYRSEIVKRLPTLKKLDGELVVSNVDPMLAQMANTA